LVKGGKEITEDDGRETRGKPIVTSNIQIVPPREEPEIKETWTRVIGRKEKRGKSQNDQERMEREDNRKDIMNKKRFRNPPRTAAVAI